MENAQKIQKRSAFLTVLFVALLAQILQSYSLPQNKETVTGCPEPYNLTVTGQTSSTISFEWDESGTPDIGYKVWYHRSEDNFISPPVITTNLYHTFSGLSSGTYDIHVVAVCEADYSGGIIVVDIVL
ncbi:MAG: fibronectin type III domain-containing protein [Saprospiraceae bacterium]|nr:fibronectin type III domain-containing protein [Saprospiraceae bacterium]